MERIYIKELKNKVGEEIKMPVGWMFVAIMASSFLLICGICPAMCKCSIA